MMENSKRETKNLGVRGKFWFKVTAFLIVGVFLFNQTAFARVYRSDESNDDFFDERKGVQQGLIYAGGMALSLVMGLAMAPAAAPAGAIEGTCMSSAPTTVLSTGEVVFTSSLPAAAAAELATIEPIIEGTCMTSAPVSVLSTGEVALTSSLPATTASSAFQTAQVAAQVAAPLIGAVAPPVGAVTSAVSAVLPLAESASAALATTALTSTAASAGTSAATTALTSAGASTLTVAAADTGVSSILIGGAVNIGSQIYSANRVWNNHEPDSCKVAMAASIVGGLASGAYNLASTGTELFSRLGLATMAVNTARWVASGYTSAWVGKKTGNPLLGTLAGLGAGVMGNALAQSLAAAIADVYFTENGRPIDGKTKRLYDQAYAIAEDNRLYQRPLSDADLGVIEQAMAICKEFGIPWDTFTADYNPAMAEGFSSPEQAETLSQAYDIFQSRGGLDRSGMPLSPSEIKVVLDARDIANRYGFSLDKFDNPTLLEEIRQAPDGQTLTKAWDILAQRSFNWQEAQTVMAAHDAFMTHGGIWTYADGSAVADSFPLLSPLNALRTISPGEWIGRIVSAVLYERINRNGRKMNALIAQPLATLAGSITTGLINQDNNLGIAWSGINRDRERNSPWYSQRRAEEPWVLARDVLLKPSIRAAVEIGLNKYSMHTGLSPLADQFINSQLKFAASSLVSGIIGRQFNTYADSRPAQALTLELGIGRPGVDPKLDRLMSEYYELERENPKSEELRSKIAEISAYIGADVNPLVRARPLEGIIWGEMKNAFFDAAHYCIPEPLGVTAGMNAGKASADYIMDMVERFGTGDHYAFNFMKNYSQGINYANYAMLSGAIGNAAFHPNDVFHYEFTDRGLEQLIRNGMSGAQAAEVFRLDTEEGRRYFAILEATRKLYVERDSAGNITFVNAPFDRFAAGKAVTSDDKVKIDEAQRVTLINDRGDSINIIGSPRVSRFRVETQGRLPSQEETTRWLDARVAQMTASSECPLSEEYMKAVLEEELKDWLREKVGASKKVEIVLDLSLTSKDGTPVWQAVIDTEQTMKYVAEAFGEGIPEVLASGDYTDFLKKKYPEAEKIEIDADKGTVKITLPGKPRERVDVQVEDTAEVRDGKPSRERSVTVARKSMGRGADEVIEEELDRDKFEDFREAYKRALDKEVIIAPVERWDGKYSVSAVSRRKVLERIEVPGPSGLPGYTLYPNTDNDLFFDLKSQAFYARHTIGKGGFLEARLEPPSKMPFIKAIAAAFAKDNSEQKQVFLAFLGRGEKPIWGDLRLARATVDYYGLTGKLAMTDTTGLYFSKTKESSVFAPSAKERVFFSYKDGVESFRLQAFTQQGSVLEGRARFAPLDSREMKQHVKSYLDSLLAAKGLSLETLKEMDRGKSPEIDAKLSQIAMLRLDREPGLRELIGQLEEELEKEILAQGPKGMPGTDRLVALVQDELGLKINWKQVAAGYKRYVSQGMGTDAAYEYIVEVIQKNELENQGGLGKIERIDRYARVFDRASDVIALVPAGGLKVGWRRDGSLFSEEWDSGNNTSLFNWQRLLDQKNKYKIDKEKVVANEPRVTLPSGESFIVRTRWPKNMVNFSGENLLESGDLFGATHDYTRVVHSRSGKVGDYTGQGIDTGNVSVIAAGEEDFRKDLRLNPSSIVDTYRVITQKMTADKVSEPREVPEE